MSGLPQSAPHKKGIAGANCVCLIILLNIKVSHRLCLFYASLDYDVETILYMLFHLHNNEEAGKAVLIIKLLFL